MTQKVRHECKNNQTDCLSIKTTTDNVLITLPGNSRGNFGNGYRRCRVAIVLCSSIILILPGRAELINAIPGKWINPK
eukprot:13677787-Heterocapsa_arctica.AAC.1